MLLAYISTLFILMSTVLAIPQVLVYTRTAGFRHDSIPTAIQSLGSLGPNNSISFTFTEDPARFTDQGLAEFDAIMFVSNSDEVLDDTGKQALQTYLDRQGNFMAVHAGCACLFTTDFFRKEVGALFDYHPTFQQATFLPLNTTHPAMTMIPDRWTFEEEVYHYRSDPRDVGAQILMTVDESSYTNDGTSSGTYPAVTSPLPIAWYQDRGAGISNDTVLPGGRSFFTSLGHSNQTWQNETFLAHIFGGLQWTLDSRTTKAYTSSGQVGTSSFSSSSITSSSTSSSSSSTTATAGISVSKSGTTSHSSTQASTSSSPSTTSSATTSSANRQSGVLDGYLILVSALGISITVAGV
ncbi:hypothetical protein [Phaffia rhodozyma]|uniref:ThuA-like domain-containing protein n=1 Tax=Phaffia rhodozyma TaxID=264483 RepID=A0A0F7SG97_PHARH|nr:hypothetical protein [Phaffia rhodozyma]